MGVATPSATMATTSEKPMTGRAPAWLRRIFIANLIAQTGIVVTGGLVRLTGSGLGCPTWPQCAPGSFVPTQHQEEAFHKYIEFGNRTLTFVLGVLAIAALLGALWWNRKLKASTGMNRKPVVWLAVIPLVGTMAQGIIGGIIVLTDLNAISVSGHFLISAALISACVLLVVRAGEPGDQPVTLLVKPAIHRLCQAMVLVAAGVLTVGTVVTAAGPHSGDADVAQRVALDPRSLSWLHADLVLLFIGLTIGLIVALAVTDAPAKARKRGWILLGMIGVQGAIGYTQYFTGLPWLVVLFHMLGACLVWISVVALYLSLRSRGVLQPEAVVDLTNA